MLTRWRTHRFLRTLPKALQGEGFIKLVFRRDIGREFNVWRAEDRAIVRFGASRAALCAVEHVFTQGGHA